MIHYNYSTFVYVTLRNPISGSEQRDVPAQVDSAADRTLLPDSVVRSLSLPQIGSIPIGGVGGVIQTMPSMRPPSMTTMRWHARSSINDARLRNWCGRAAAPSATPV